MHNEYARACRAVAGGGFIVLWMTLGLVNAVLVLVGAVLAAELPRLSVIVSGKRVRTAPRRGRADNLPLVPDDPSLVLTIAEL